VPQAHAELLTAANTLTKRLTGHTDRRTASGLLVCIRAAAAPDEVAGVLKLQVVADHAAVLECLETGKEVLPTVTKLLDKPGDPQKGALVTSSTANGWQAGQVQISGWRLASPLPGVLTGQEPQTMPTGSRRPHMACG
jgi:hypothetical protein